MTSERLGEMFKGDSKVCADGEGGPPLAIAEISNSFCFVFDFLRVCWDICRSHDVDMYSEHGGKGTCIICGHVVRCAGGVFCGFPGLV